MENLVREWPSLCIFPFIDKKINLAFLFSLLLHAGVIKWASYDTVSLVGSSEGSILKDLCLSEKFCRTWEVQNSNLGCIIVYFNLISITVKLSHGIFPGTEISEQSVNIQVFSCLIRRRYPSHVSNVPWYSVRNVTSWTNKHTNPSRLSNYVPRMSLACLMALHPWVSSNSAVERPN